MPDDLIRAVLPEDLRGRMIERVMARDNLKKDVATRIVNGLRPHDLCRLEMELRDHEQPAFTAEYDPFGRG